MTMFGAIIRTDWTVETNKPDEIEINHFVSPGYKNIILNAQLLSLKNLKKIHQ